jgi:hypothetical protein
MYTLGEKACDALGFDDKRGHARAQSLRLGKLYGDVRQAGAS